MIMYYKIISFILLLIIASALNSRLVQAASEGKTGMAFLKVGVGARASGMGEAFSAVVNDATASYWNPAALLSAKGPNASLVYNSWLLDVKSEFGSLQFSRSWAVSVYSFHLSDIPVRTIPSSEPIENTGAQYFSFAISHARAISKKLHVGLTVKYLFEKIHVNSATGGAVDIGLRYKITDQKLNFAAVIQNLGGMGKMVNESTTLPALSRFGVMYELPRTYGPMNILLAADFLVPFKENLRANFGTELTFWRQLLLRAGFMGGNESRSLSFGIGVSKSWFRFDYSLTHFKNDLETGHHFSIFLAL
jgi:hypothetical protein